MCNHPEQQQARGTKQEHSSLCLAVGVHFFFFFLLRDGQLVTFSSIVRAGCKYKEQALSNLVLIILRVASGHFFKK